MVAHVEASTENFLVAQSRERSERRGVNSQKNAVFGVFFVISEFWRTGAVGHRFLNLSSRHNSGRGHR